MAKVELPEIGGILNNGATLLAKVKRDEATKYTLETWIVLAYSNTYYVTWEAYIDPDYGHHSGTGHYFMGTADGFVAAANDFMKRAGLNVQT